MTNATSYVSLRSMEILHAERANAHELGKEHTVDNWSIGGTREEFNKPPEDFELPPVGVYMFELTGKDADEKQKPEYDPTGTKFRTRFKFTVVDDEDWEGTVVAVYYNLTLNERGYFLPVVEALLGRPLLPKEQVGWTDDASNNVVGIKGLRMMGTLKHDTKNAGTEAERTYGRIESPFPVKRKGRKSAATDVTNSESAVATEAPF